jgi:hypothetical protein
MPNKILLSKSQSCPTLTFGHPDPMPQLPDGWRYVSECNDWLQAEDAQGGHYYIGPTMAYPCRRSPNGKAWWCQTDKPETWITLSEARHA